jgi:hypothetical protein
MEVAIAAPSMPSAGSPSRPKISIQLSSALTAFPIHITQVAGAINVRPCRYWRNAEYSKKQGTVGSLRRL